MKQSFSKSYLRMTRGSLVFKVFDLVVSFHMLSFFRSYQRIFFYMMAGVMILSSVFFSLSSVMTEDRSSHDPHVAFTVDGEAVKRSEVKNLSRFLQVAADDVFGDNRYPNLCNHGVIELDFLKTGLANLLVKHYFDELKGDFDVRLEKAKRFQPYAHPQVRFLSVESLWGQISQDLVKAWKELKETPEASAQLFEQLVFFYQRQKEIRPEAVRNMFGMQIQSQKLAWDPALSFADCSFFGFHSLTDWFGTSFIDMVSQFILNGAVLAEQKGFDVSFAEAKGDLLFQFETSLQKLPPQAKESFVSLSDHLHRLGLSEKDATETWRKVLLFRRYFETASNAVFKDHLGAEHFASFAKETARITKYEWPHSLSLRTEDDLVRFEIYLASVGSERKNPLELPSEYFSEEEILSQSPDLLQSTLKGDCASVSLIKMGLRSSLRDVWDWQLSDGNWDLLCEKFGIILSASSKEERGDILDKLAPNLREQADQFARLEIVKGHPEWIEEALSTAALQSVSFLSKSPHPSAFSEDDGLALSALASKAYAGDAVAQSSLSCYFGADGKNVYRIQNIEQVRPVHLITFQEAKEGKYLKILEDQYLKKYYRKIRDEHASKFQDQHGKWRPFFEVKSEVSRLFLAPLLNLLKESLPDKKPLAFYASERMKKIMEIAQGALRKNRNDPRWVQRGDGLISDQFKLQAAEQKVQRGLSSRQEEWMKSTAFTLYPNEWSSIHVSPEGDASFFYLEERDIMDECVLDQASLDQQEPEVLGALGADAWCCLGEKLLRTIEELDAIRFSFDQEL